MRGKNPKSHTPRGGAKKGERRKPQLYEGAPINLTFWTSRRLAQRLEFQIETQGRGRNAIFNEWLETLPLSPAEKTEQMQEKYELVKELKKAGL